jgi:hypothetical protein
VCSWRAEAGMFGVSERHRLALCRCILHKFYIDIDIDININININKDIDIDIDVIQLELCDDT